MVVASVPPPSADKPVAKGARTARDMQAWVDRRAAAMEGTDLEVAATAATVVPGTGVAGMGGLGATTVALVLEDEAGTAGTAVMAGMEAAKVAEADTVDRRASISRFVRLDHRTG